MASSGQKLSPRTARLSCSGFPGALTRLAQAREVATPRSILAASKQTPCCQSPEVPLGRALDLQYSCLRDRLRLSFSMTECLKRFWTARLPASTFRRVFQEHWLQQDAIHYVPHLGSEPQVKNNLACKVRISEQTGNVCQTITDLQREPTATEQSVQLPAASFVT